MRTGGRGAPHFSPPASSSLPRSCGAVRQRRRPVRYFGCSAVCGRCVRRPLLGGKPRPTLAGCSRAAARGRQGIEECVSQTGAQVPSRREQAGALEERSVGRELFSLASLSPTQARSSGASRAPTPSCPTPCSGRRMTALAAAALAAPATPSVPRRVEMQAEAAPPVRRRPTRTGTAWATSSETLTRTCNQRRGRS